MSRLLTLEAVLAKTYASLGMTEPAITEKRWTLALNPRRVRYQLSQLY